jgi:hypothetical protein
LLCRRTSQGTSAVSTYCTGRFASTLPDARYLRVRSEDVLNDRRVQLRAIAAWLGVRSDDAAVDAMLNPAASPFAKDTSSNN